MSSQEWKPTFFHILVENKHGFENLRLNGYSNGTFGIDQRSDQYGSDCCWTLTHLGTGFRCWDFESLEGAQAMGNALTKKYSEAFAALRAEGLILNNFKSLRDAVMSDEELKEIWRLEGLGLTRKQKANLKRLIIES